MAEVERPLAPYLQIIASLRAQIADGTLQEGTAVPSERHIASGWGVSRTTATKVLAALRSEGLVESRQGIGTVVKSRVVVSDSACDRFTTMRRTGRIYGPGEYARILSAELIDAPDSIAGALGLTVGDQVIRRERVTYRDDAPVSVSRSYFGGSLARLAPGLLETERLSEGTPGYVQAAAGLAATSGRDQVTAGAATAADAGYLGTSEGAPVRISRNWLYDMEGNTIEYGESVSLAGRWASYDYKIAD